MKKRGCPNISVFGIKICKTHITLFLEKNLQNCASGIRQKTETFQRAYISKQYNTFLYQKSVSFEHFTAHI